MAVHQPTIYSILGVDTNATKQEIKSAYRSLARRLHPDVYTHVGHDDFHPWPPVQRSYAILTDQSKRLVYDDIVVRGGAMKLADPERFERWWASHIRVDYETGAVRKGSELFHQMGPSEIALLHNRHRIAWGFTAALAAAQGARMWRAWVPQGAAVIDASEHGRAERTAFLGGLLGGAGASWGQLAFGVPVGSTRAAALVVGLTAAGAGAGGLSLGLLYRAAAGRDPALADSPTVRAAHANSASVYQAFGIAFGAAHAARSAPVLGRAHLRVAAAGLVGSTVALLCDRLISGRGRTSVAVRVAESETAVADA